MKRYKDKEGREYILKSNYRDNEILRESFNELTAKTYGFTFENWYKQGYWGKRYIPYSFIFENKVVSNVSVNVIEFDALGKRKTYVQLGTVMTEKSFRGRGLSRALIEGVINEWQDKCDLIYLFANDSVLDFYPKFGFVEAAEYEYSRELQEYKNIADVRKLDMAKQDDKDLLYDLASSCRSISKISMRDNADLVMFYCTSFMKDDIYYIEEYKAAAVCEFDNDTLIAMDIFMKDENTSIDDVISAIAAGNTCKIKFGFTPNNAEGYERKVLKEEDTTLFVNKKDIFKDKFLMFPMLSHA